MHIPWSAKLLFYSEPYSLGKAWSICLTTLLCSLVNAIDRVLKLGGSYIGSVIDNSLIYAFVKRISILLDLKWVIQCDPQHNQQAASFSHLSLYYDWLIIIIKSYKTWLMALFRIILLRGWAKKKWWWVGILINKLRMCFPIEFWCSLSLPN